MSELRRSRVSAPPPCKKGHLPGRRKSTHYCDMSHLPCRVPLLEWTQMIVTHLKRHGVMLLCEHNVEARSARRDEMLPMPFRIDA